MPDHYYTQRPESAHKPRTVEVAALGRTLTFDTDTGVFSRDGLDPGSRLLIESAPALSGRVLDLGCGWGAVGAFLATSNPAARLLLSDVNERAVELARRNLRANRIDNADVMLCDGFAAIDGTFSAIFTNPPIRAGKAVIYGLFDEARKRLDEDGQLYVVIRKQQGAPSALTHLRAVFSAAEVVKRGGGYWIIRAY